MIAGAPYSSAGYERQTLDGIEVYISSEMDVGPEGIFVDLVGWGPFRYLTLDGVA
ncbi:MAG: hypothetical protein GX062_03685 [Firmicutes bacterium]|nr:hypothetical protein [Bacillota bacterium]